MINWYRPSEIRQDEFIRIKKDILELITESLVELNGLWGLGSPIINDDLICFNGDGDKSYNNFEVPRKYISYGSYIESDYGKLYFQGTNTNNFPYTELVIASLYAFAYHCKAFKLNINGIIDNDHFKSAKSLYEDVLLRKMELDDAQIIR